VYQVFPSSLTGLLEFTLTYFYAQFNASTLTVVQVQINIGAPDWAVIPDQFAINNTNFSVQVMNPFSSVSRSTTFYISGDFIVGTVKAPPRDN